jgi:hypothetical protein
MQINNGSGWDGSQDGTDEVFGDMCDKNLTEITTSGAIVYKGRRILLNAGSGLQLTLAAPISGTRSDGGDDGKRLKVTTLTAQAHVITCSTVGFNAKGSSGTVTFTAAIGNSCIIEAYKGNWYVTDNNGVTVA